MGEYQTAGIVTELLAWIKVAAIALELLAVTIIMVAALMSTAIFIRGFFTGAQPKLLYEEFKLRLGRGLLLGLEMLVAADVIRTLALEPTLANVAFLAILMLIRTFLSWSIVVELEHRWPWQPPTQGDGATGAHED